MAIPIAKADVHRVFVVSGSGLNCTGAQFTRIQDAIDAAAPNDSVHICGGIYNEQPHIDKSLDIDADPEAFLVPINMLANANSLADGGPIAAAFYASGAPHVEISGLTVDTIGSGISECAPRLLGVYYQNASGVLAHVKVRNTKLGPTLNGCQSGTGIFVESGQGGRSVVEIRNCPISEYQKNGITANEVGTVVTIQGNVVTGVGPTPGAAQNGIQVGYGATGKVERNVVTGNLWFPCQVAATCVAVATDILVFESDKVKVIDNTVGETQIGVFAAANDGLVSHNRVFSISVFDGIRIEGNGNNAKENKVFESAESDVFVQGNDNSIEENILADAPVGVLEAAGSAGNRIRNNRYIDVLVPVQDPPGGSLAGKVSPER